MKCLHPTCHFGYVQMPAKTVEYIQASNPRSSLSHQFSRSVSGWTSRPENWNLARILQPVTDAIDRIENNGLTVTAHSTRTDGATYFRFQLSTTGKINRLDICQAP